jgi:predicted alpha/beta superfamily hydrolase
MSRIGGAVLALLLSGLATPLSAAAQVSLVSEGDMLQEGVRKFVLRSEKLGRDMFVVVAAPRAGGIGIGGQRPAETKLPAVYALDNGWGVAGPVGQFMSFAAAMSPAYVVSIGYVGPDNRENDFSFQAITHNNLKLGDGGPKFLAFLTDELRPFLETRYPLDSRQAVLFGHSLGGLFAANVLASKPDAFAGYIIGSPSVRYDAGLIDRLRLGARSAGERRVFVAAGAREDQVTIEGAEKIAAALAGSAVKVEKHIYAGENHISYYARLAPEGFAFVLPPPIRYEPAVVLAAAELDRVTGAYRMPDGRVTSVKRDGAKLFVQMTGLGGQAELMPETATHFFIPGFDSVLVFELPASGQATAVDMKINGISIRAVRQ